MENNNIAQTQTPTQEYTPRKAAKYYNRTGGAICLHFVINQVVQVIAIIIIALVLTFTSNEPKNISKQLTSGPVLLYLIAISYIVANITGSIIGFALNGKLKNSFKGMFTKPGISCSLMSLCIPAAMCIQSVSMILQTLFVSVTGSSGMENMQMPQIIPGNTMNNVVYVLYIAILGPITEELFFRGAVMKGFNFAGQKFAIVFSAFWFAVFHGNILQAMIAFLLGIFFGYLNVKTGSILPSVLLHITNNSIATLLEVISLSMSENTLNIFYIIYLAITIILGGICLFIVLSKLKKQETKENKFFEPEFCPEQSEAGKYGLRTAVKSPCLWIAFIIYAVLIAINIF